MNLSLEHIAIPATNPVALKKWYERVLGARLIWDNGQKPPVCLIELPGGAWLEIYATDLPLADRGNNKLAGFRHLALRVDSIDAAKAELSRRGVKFDDKILHAAGGGRVLFFNDGEGNLLHLIERPKDWQPGKADKTPGDEVRQA
jgi:catechol 2,3-dioxygenase-like lactoylglutathione lyase family enzyme